MTTTASALEALHQATARAIAASVKTAGEFCEHGDTEGAEAAILRAEQRLKELREVLPGHARLVRQSEDLIRMARRALTAPVKLENYESGYVEPRREQLARRAQRASARARA